SKMIRRNPTRLEIRQDDVERLQSFRQEYKKKLSQKPGASGK
ncbi:14521_t:CDS:1, partial [Acaulospora morrowiae]